jgi:hypothetical protein
MATENNIFIRPIYNNFKSCRSARSNAVEGEKLVFDNDLDKKIHEFDLPCASFKHYAKSITILPEHLKDKPFFAFISKHFEQYETLFRTYRGLKNQIKLLNNHNIVNGIKYSEDGELFFKTGESVQLLINALKTYPEEYILTEFGLTKPRDFDTNRPLKPSYKINGWKGGYCLDLVETYSKGSAVYEFTSNHSYFKLTDADGYVTTAGKYPVKTLWSWGNYMKQGTQQIVNPDTADCAYPEENQKYARITLSKEQYEMFTHDIINVMSGDNGAEDYNYFNKNCASWAIDMLKEAKYLNIPKLDNSEFETSMIEALLSNHIPRFLSKTTTLITSTVLAFSGLWVGKAAFVLSQGGKVKNIENEDSKPLCEGWKDLIRPRFAPFISPKKAVEYLNKKFDQRCNIELKKQEGITAAG